MKQYDEILYVPADIDMVEIAMEIQGQFHNNESVKVVYENTNYRIGVNEGDVIGIFTVEGLKKEGYLS